ncbi:MAG: sulfite exporter TauE/SafE family protein [Sporichthyaceae bacterium]
MDAWDAVAILFAGGAAGAINAVVGSGTLITFPTLLALGYPAVIANVSNTVGLVPGSAAAVWAYREQLRGQRALLMRLLPATCIGSTIGATLLLTAPERAFRTVVPALIGLACVLVLVQPRLTRWLAGRPASRSRFAVLTLAVGLTGIYAGYFGAAQGVLLIAFLSVFLVDDLQRLNGVKNVLALLGNGVAALIFMTVHHIDWGVAGLIAAGSIAGGLIGGRYGRNLSAPALRGCIVLIGVVAIVRLVL